jgi:hypothetical protein
MLAEVTRYLKRHDRAVDIAAELKELNDRHTSVEQSDSPITLTATVDGVPMELRITAEDAKNITLRGLQVHSRVLMREGAALQAEAAPAAPALKVV